MGEVTEQEIEFLVKETKSILRDLTKNFSAWLDDAFTQKFGPNYWQNVKQTLGRTEDEKRNLASWSKISDLDLFGLLKLAERNYQVLQSIYSVSKDYKSNLQRMKDVRHSLLGHEAAEIIELSSLEDHLITIKRFSEKIKLPQYLLTKVEDLKDRVTQLNLVNKGKLPHPGYIEIKDNNIIPIEQIKNNYPNNFIEFVDKYELTNSQMKAVKNIDTFLKDDSKQCFILKGYAGTGKTFLIGLLVNYLRNCRINSRIMAPTGRAARVIAERFNVGAGTIHRNIYYSKELKQYESKDESGKVTYKWYFSLLNNDNDQGTIFIVDESSMISDVYTENEFIRFGSGKLLSDLLQYINFDGNDNKKKILLIGDDAQLPPVDMNQSPALEDEYLKKNFNLEISSAQLIDVVRQKENSKILELAKIYRNSIENNIQNNFKFIYDNKEITKVEQVNFISKYFEITHKKVDNETILITFTNASAADYNKIIRKTLFNNPSDIQKGDRIIVVKNNYSSLIDIMNGQMGFVMNVSPFSETHPVPLNKGKRESGGKDIVFIELIFRQLEIKFIDTDGTEHILPFMALENLLNNDQAGITSEESKAQYVFFKQRNPNLKPGSIEFKQAIHSDRYFNALHIKYGYAITCHKAQGGSWKNVFVDFAERNTLSTDVLRWGYTAVTRAESYLFTTNTKDHSLLRFLDMSKDDLLDIETEPEFVPMEIDSSSKAIDSRALPENFNTSEKFMEEIFSKVYSILPENCQLIENIHRDFLEQYKFLYEGNKLIVKLHYKNNYKISNVQCSNFPDELVDVKAQIYNLKGDTFAGDDMSEGAQSIDNYKDDSNYIVLKEINDKYKDFGMIISINKVSDYHYPIRVQFNNQSETFNFFLDGKHRLTKFIPVNTDYNKVIFNRVLRIHLTK